MKKSKMMNVLTEHQVSALLAKACEEAGSQLAWAREHEIAPTLVSMTLIGTRSPAKKILKALGLKKVIHYTKG